MATFKQYELKNGEKKWLFQSYLGTDPVTGKEIRTTRRGYRTKKEAQLEEKRLQVEVLEGGGLNKVNATTFEEVYLLWFEQYKNTVKESSLFKTKELFERFILKEYGQLKLEKITVKHCQKTINHWFKQTKKYKLLNNYTSNVLDYAISMEIIKDNPARKISIPRKKDLIIDDTNTKKFYDKSELKLFFELLSKKTTVQPLVFFRVLAFSGIRKGEALALTWADINFNDNTLRINKTLSVGLNNQPIVLTPKTKKSARTISLDDRTLNILKNWKHEQRKILLKQGYNTINTSQLVFTSKNNTHLSVSIPARWLKSTVKNSDLAPITVHGFRHTHCSLLFEAGASIQEVQERLGHSDIKTTMDIYTHVTKNKKEETASKFANYVNF